jgi:hypothetical protein
VKFGLGDSAYRPPGFHGYGYSEQYIAEQRASQPNNPYWRHVEPWVWAVCDIVCSHCRRRTRHALVFGFDRPDVDQIQAEKITRWGGESLPR